MCQKRVVFSQRDTANALLDQSHILSISIMLVLHIMCCLLRQQEKDLQFTKQLPSLYETTLGLCF